MVHKTEQQRIKALITEAISVLCKEYLGYRTKLSIEGLLGITLDEDDIFLVSIRELIHKDDDGTSRGGRVEMPDSVVESTFLSQAQAKAHSLLLHQTTLQHQHHQQQQQQQALQHRQLQEQNQELSSREHPVQALEQVLLPSITGPTILMSTGPPGRGGQLTPQILSPTSLPFRALSVDHISTAVAMANRRTTSIPLSQSSDQISYASTIDSALGSSISSSLPSPQVGQRRRRTNSEQSEPPAKRAAPSTESCSNDSASISGGETLMVKPEPLSDSETEGTSRSVDSDLTVQTPVFSMSSSEGLPGSSTWSGSISVTSVQTVSSPATPNPPSTQISPGIRSLVSTYGNSHGNHHGNSRSTPAEPSAICALHRSILEQSGCIVFASNVVLQDGTKTHTRTNAHMVQAMQEMTYPIGHPRHVGQYKEVMAGRYSRKVFYKCPPEIVRQEILGAYGITQKQYTKMFYSDVKPVTSSSKWFETVETLMLNFPYGPRLFPLQMMGLTEDQMRVLSMVRVYKENKLNHK